MLGKQAALRGWQAGPAGCLGVEAIYPVTVTERVGHAFRRMPVHSKVPSQMQTKLEGKTPDDIYEQEADRVSERVLSMPAPQAVSSQSDDGKRIRKDSAGDRSGEANGTPERKELSGASGWTLTGAPALVHAVLNSPGQPLDAGSRAFFEPRFGHDFGHVRIHADGLAATSARAVDAQAYTVKEHIAFGPGQYAPATLRGRKLLAHELTHVMQQSTSANQLRPGSAIVTAADHAGSGLLQRQPDKPSRAEQKREQRLEDLARDPGEAHRAWKQLSEAERLAVEEKMERRYGAEFARQFRDEVKKGKPKLELHHYGRGVGPKPEELVATGHRLGWTEMYSAELENQFWVHPSGELISRDISTWTSGAPEPKNEPENKTPPPKVPPPREIEEEPPPLTDQQREALDDLEDLQLRNNELQDALNANPFPSKQAQDAQASWAFSRARLRELKDVDMHNVDPEFWKDVDAATSENDDLLKQLAKLDPAFSTE